jgi:hypothetical protein
MVGPILVNRSGSLVEKTKKHLTASPFQQIWQANLKETIPFFSSRGAIEEDGAEKVVSVAEKRTVWLCAQPLR